MLHEASPAIAMDAKAVKRPVVLLVDDDVPTARVLARLLSEDGYAVEIASDGAAAIRRLTRDPLPDVLITDMTMPFADGITVTRYARSRRANLPVFVITGSPSLVTRRAADMDPPPVVLTKPLHYESFSAELRRAVPVAKKP